MQTILLSNKIRFSIIFFLFSLTSFAQITGKVTDTKGDALIGVSVTIKNTTKGTTSDTKGTYSIDAAADQNLVFSFIGCATQEVKVGNQANINISLQEDAAALDEVVVTGVFDKRTKMNASVAISTLNTKQIEALVPNSAADLLKNIPGVYVNTSRGEVGNYYLTLSSKF